eukprot:GILK01010596.1.p1 GENE.GILK01010596.1~~GILK01010596.1.p1  ORF type:complete len:408 (+),score=68.54 GILK01010596.1:72-1295(+)
MVLLQDLEEFQLLEAMSKPEELRLIDDNTFSIQVCPHVAGDTLHLFVECELVFQLPDPYPEVPPILSATKVKGFESSVQSFVSLLQARAVLLAESSSPSLYEIIELARETLTQYNRGASGECAVCLSSLLEAETEDGSDSEGLFRIRSCQHRFHRQCLLNWWEKASNFMCPLCRKEASKEDIYAIFPAQITNDDATTESDDAKHKILVTNVQWANDDPDALLQPFSQYKPSRAYFLTRARKRLNQAVVEFCSASHALQATLALHQTDIQGEVLQCRLATDSDFHELSSLTEEEAEELDRERRRKQEQLLQPLTTPTVLVTGVPLIATNQSLKTMFDSYGAVTGQVVYHNGLSTGFGLVTFRTAQDAEALQRPLTLSVLKQKQLSCRLATRADLQLIARVKRYGVGSG